MSSPSRSGDEPGRQWSEHRGTAAELHLRNARIAARRAEGATFRSIAGEIGLDERSVRRAYGDYVAYLGEHTLGSEAVFNVLERLDDVVAKASELYDRHVSTNTNAAIGALKIILRAQTETIALIGLAGTSEADLQLSVIEFGHRTAPLLAVSTAAKASTRSGSSARGGTSSRGGPSRATRTW